MRANAVLISAFFQNRLMSTSCSERTDRHAHARPDGVGAKALTGLIFAASEYRVQLNRICAKKENVMFRKSRAGRGDLA
jgi:hypothetical protein